MPPPPRFPRERAQAVGVFSRPLAAHLFGQSRHNPVSDCLGRLRRVCPRGPNSCFRPRGLIKARPTRLESATQRATARGYSRDRQTRNKEEVTSQPKPAARTPRLAGAGQIPRASPLLTESLIGEDCYAPSGRFSSQDSRRLYTVSRFGFNPSAAIASIKRPVVFACCCCFLSKRSRR